MIQMIDMHMHTTNSDGELPTEKLIEQVKANNIKYFSVTDHDSVESINDIKKCDISGLTYIKGVEISSILDNKYKMHILAYNIDETNQKLLKTLKKLRSNRKRRIYIIADTLKEKYNIELTKQELDHIINTNPIPGRPHIAKLLIEKGYGKNGDEIFEKYLGDIETSLITEIDVKEVIKLIHQAGGYAIWAHPKRVEEKYNVKFEEIIPKLVAFGLDGIEAFNNIHPYTDAKRYLKYAQNHQLLVSGGSDFHGPNLKPNAPLGKLYKTKENIKIDIKAFTILDKIIR